MSGGEGGGREAGERVRRLPAQRLGRQARPALPPHAGVVSAPARAGLRGARCLPPRPPSLAASEPWGCRPQASPGGSAPPRRPAAAAGAARSWEL